MLRWIVPLVLWILIAQAIQAQAIDSVRIFKSIPRAGYSTSLAETTGWKLQRSGAPYVSVGASDLQGLNEQLEKRRPVKHTHTQLPGLTHIGFIYLDKAAHVFCLADEEGLIIDLTARRQFRLEDWTDRMKLRAALVALGL
jgi:hypothetical protein